MRKARLMNCSLLAIAAMLVSMPPLAVRAQSFNATGVMTHGVGAIDVATVGQTNVFLDSPVAVIDWATNEPAGGSGPITFQPAGTTATYINRDATTFTVLNRITPNDVTRSVRFNGTVISRLQNFATGLITRGGTLFFYSPGGILVGSTGAFDVGSLVLTASDLAYDPVTGDFGKGGTYNFLTANPGSSVQVQAGAQITAGPLNSYVALVAPKVVNAGTITVDGSAVLVAADASTITFRPNGLFDIQIDQGTSETGEVVTNTGTITGAAGSINTAHRVYVVAVPKNDAITMAIKGGSTLGFDVAAAADVDGNAIVLSAGYDVSDGVIQSTRSAGGGTGRTVLDIGAIAATSQVTGRATGAASIQVQGGDTASFASNVSIAGVSDPGSPVSDGAFVSVAGVGSTLDISGDFAVTALDGGAVTAGGFSESGNAEIVVDRGSLTVGGDLQLSVSRNPAFGVDALAGEAAFEARGGAAVNVGGNLSIGADGVGKTISDASSGGPNPGSGGTARITFGSGAAVNVEGDLSVSAFGSGGAAETPGYAGSAGTGGSVVIDGLGGGGTFTVTGTTTLNASGIGGDGLYCSSCTVEGGAGEGGSAGIIAAPGTQFNFGGALTVDASGQGGRAIIDGGKGGGDGIGGTAFVRSSGGEVAADAGLSVFADGAGGAGASNDNALSGSTGVGGTGGVGTGGTATLAAGDVAAVGRGGSIAITGDTVVSASGTGATGGAAGGVGLGGAATVAARDGTVGGAALSTRALGLGGAGTEGGPGGTAKGGKALVMAFSALEGDAAVTFGTTAITARGTGGAGSTPPLLGGAGGVGGGGSGGTASALAEAGNAVLTLGDTSINASGGGGAGGTGGNGFSVTGGDGGAGGSASGGIATFGVVSGLETGAVNTGSATFAGASVLANGIGGTAGAGGFGGIVGAAGTGGTARGGAATLVVEGGAVTVSATAQVQANALGGGGGLGAGGNAFVGGTAGGDGLVLPLGVRLEVGSRTGHADQQGRLIATSLALDAEASGGKGVSTGSATNLGNPLTFRLDGGTINAGSLGFAAVGDTLLGALPSVIALAGGDTTLTSGFSFVTPGTLTAALGGAELFSDTASISASNWLSGAVPAGAVGTIHGTTSVSLVTGADLFGNFSADTQGSLTVSAGGLVRLDNLSAGGAISVDAGTTLSLGNLTSGSTVLVTAPGNASVGNVVSVGDATLTSGAALAAGGVTSRQSVRLRGATSLTLAGDVVGGASVRLSSGGTVTGQGLSAGLVNPSAVSGASYDVTVVGLGGIGLGDVAAARDIKLFTPLTLTTGALAGREIALLAGGAQSIGSIAATGRVLLADYSMGPIGGDPLGSYDIDVLFAAAPIAAGGSIDVLGNSNAGSLAARSVGDFSAKALIAAGAIDLQAGGAIATGALGSTGRIDASAGGTMDLASASADGFLVLNASDAITTGTLFGGSGVRVTGLGGVNTGAVASGSGGTDVRVVSGGAMNLGAVTADNLLFLDAGGLLTSGVLSGDSVAVKGADRVTVAGVSFLTGSATLTAGNDLATGTVIGGGSISLTSTAGSVTTGDLGALFGAVGISANGSVSVGNVQALAGMAIGAGTNITMGSGVTDDGDVVLTATGNINAGNLRAPNGNLRITAGGAAVLGDLFAIGLSGEVGLQVTAGTTLDLGQASVDSGELRLTSGGSMIAGDLTASGGVLTVDSGGSASLGNLTVSGLAGGTGLTVSAKSTLGLGSASVTAGALLLTSGGALSGLDFTTGAGVLTVNSGGNLSTRGLTGHNGIAVTSGGDVTLTGLASSAAGDVVFGVTGAMATRGVTAAGRIGLTATGAITTNDLTATGALAVKGTALVLGNLAASTIGIDAATTLDAGSVTARAGDAVLGSAGALSAGAVTASGAARLTSSGGNLSAGAINAGGAITATANGTLDVTSAKAGDLLTLGSSGALTAGDLGGTNGVTLTGLAGIATGKVDASAGAVSLTAANDLAAGAVTASGAAALTSNGGSVAAGDVSSTGSTVAITAKGATSAGNVVAANGIAIGAGGSLGLTSATSTAGDVALDATGNLITGDLAASGGRLLVSTAGAAALGDLDAAGLAGGVGLSVATGTTLTLGDAAVGAGELRLTSGGVMTGRDLTANGGALTIDAVGTLGARTLAGRDGIAVKAGGNTKLTGDAVSSAGDVTLAVTGGLDAQAIGAAKGLVSVQGKTSAAIGRVTAAQGIAISSDGALVTGDLQGLAVNVTGGSTLQSGTVTASGGAVSLAAEGDLAAGRIFATGAVSAASSGGKVTGQAIDAGGNLSLTAAGDLEAGALASGGSLDASGVNVTLGNLRAARVNVGASGALTFAAADATAGDAGFLANGALRGGAITAVGAIKLTGLAAVTTGDLTAGGSVLIRATGDAAFGAVRGSGGTVELRSEDGSLTVGAVTATSDAALAAATDLAVGAVNARDMLLLAGGNVRAASLTSPDGRVLVASNTLVTAGGAVGGYDFDAVFAAPVRATGGTLTVTGGVSGGALTVAVGGDAALLGVDAARTILIDAGGTARLGGVWKAPKIEIRSNDIAMPAGSGLNSGLTGTISLVSRNLAGMRIGDGLDDSVIPANGYTLDNAEWSRINSGSLSVFGLDGAGPVDILIGTLDVTGPDAGSTIDDPAGTVLLRTGGSPAAAASGTIRVTGALTAQGFRAGNTLAFETGQFQLASDTGSVAVLGKADALSGALRIEAQDIHVAAAPLLARMAADPFFAGLETALDTESSGGSQPVLRAGALDLKVGRTLYIQRSGTGIDPLGFDDPLDGFQVRRTGLSPITVIINGTFRTAAGVIGGIAAWQQFKDSGADLSGFTADSRLNGCLLSAATCGVAPRPDPRPDPDPGFRTLIEVLGDPGLGETPPDDPDKPARKATNAILPPQSVLPFQPDALPVQIDEPIAGSGNAALIGGAIGMSGTTGQ